MMDVMQCMCRLCSVKLHKSRNIFTTRGLLDKITKFTGIKIQKGDGLPCSICDPCYIKLQIIEEFRQQAERTDDLIRDLALKQNAECNKSALAERALRQNGVPEMPENGNHGGFRPYPNRRGEICRERMHSSERIKSWRAKLPQNVTFKSRITENSLTYSYETAQSLVASYKALINRCRLQGFPQEFVLPSGFLQSDNESGLKMDERAARSAVARRQRESQKFTADKISLRNMTRSLPNFSDDFPGRGIQDAISPRVPVDPLNLLRIKSVRPIVDEESDLSSTESFEGSHTSRITSWKNGTPVHPGVDEDLEDQSSTEFSNSSDEFSPSGSTSPSWSSIENTPVPRPRKAPLSPPSKGSAKNGANDPEASKNRQLGTQCPICDRILRNVQGLKVHAKIHRAEKCQICEAPTETNEKFRDHLQLHIRPIESGTTFKCLICKNLFKTKIGLNAHMRIHSLSVPAVKECPHCKRSFGTLQGYKVHLTRSHSGLESREI